MCLSTSEVTDFGWTRPPEGVSSAAIIAFPPTCSLGTLLTFQWQGCLLCIVLTSDAGTTKQTCTTGTSWTKDTNWWTLHTPSVPQSPNSFTTHSPLLCSCCDQHHLSSSVPRPAPMQHQTLPPAPQFQRHDSPYSSLPSSGLGVFGGPQQQQRPSGPVYSPPAGEMKDSPPSSIIGQEFQAPPAGQQRRAHSQMLSMTTRPSVQQQPPHIYSNLPLPHTPPNTAVPGSGGGYLGSQRRQSGPPSAVMRQPHTQEVAVTRRGPAVSVLNFH